MTQARTLRAAILMLTLLSLPALGACKRDSTGPEEIIIPKDLVQRQVLTGRVNICTVGPAGDYAFTIAREGGVTGGTLLVDPTFSVPAGGCRDVWVATSTTRNPDPSTTVTITGAARPAETTFDHISAAATNNDRDYTIGANSIVFRVNYYHGGVVTFFYKPATR
jgi:hypothetical protein